MQPQLVKKRQHYQVLPRRKGGKERGSEGRQVEDKDSFSLIEENDDQWSSGRRQKHSFRQLTKKTPKQLKQKKLFFSFSP